MMIQYDDDRDFLREMSEAAAVAFSPATRQSLISAIGEISTARRDFIVLPSGRNMAALNTAWAKATRLMAELHRPTSPQAA